MIAYTQKTKLDYVNYLRNELQAIQNAIYEEEIKGAEVCSRIKWVSESDKNPNFFKSFEKKHQKNNFITCLKNDEGQVVNKKHDIISL